jgi:hypothetical protein
MLGTGLPIVMAMGSVIRLVAILASSIVLLGFGLFAVDEADRGSKTQQHALDQELGAPGLSVDAIAPSPKEEALREKEHSPFREVVDDANDVLLAPFVDLIDSDNTWVTHGVPALLGLLLYGVGLGFVANLLPRGRAHGGDWRTAES